MRVVLLMLLSVVLGTLFVSAILAHAAYDMRRRGRKERPHYADTAIVLGAYTNGYDPSPPLRARLRTALHLYRNGLVPTLIVSGGKGEDESVSESRSMKRFLIINGVPPEAILEDRYSTDTWENLYNSTELMKKYGLKTAIIVTSDYHLPRALSVAKQLQFEACGYAAISSRGEFKFAIREVLARLQYIMKGQASIT